MSNQTESVRKARESLSEENVVPADGDAPPSVALGQETVALSPSVLRAESAYWKAKYDQSRERVGKLWLLLQDAENDLAELRSKLETYEVPAPKPAPTSPAKKAPVVLEPAVVYGEPKEGPEAEKEAEASNKPFVFNGYTLYAKDVRLKGGRKQEVHFFSKEAKPKAVAIPKPEGFVVAVSDRTSMPFLKRAEPGDEDGMVVKSHFEKRLRPQCAALTDEGGQCRNSARKGSDYCISHKGYQPKTAANLVQTLDTRPLESGVRDTSPALKGAGIRATMALEHQQCAALGAGGKQCRREAREGSRYCEQHKNYHPKSPEGLVRLRDTKPRVAGAPDTPPAIRKSVRSKG